MRFNSKLIAADYMREFEQMFEGQFGTSKSSGTPYPRMWVGAAPIEVYFSPENGVAKYVVQRLKVVYYRTRQKELKLQAIGFKLQATDRRSPAART